MLKEATSMLFKHHPPRLFSLLIFSSILSMPLPCAHVLGESNTQPKKGQIMIASKTPEQGTWPIELRVSLFVEVPQQVLWRVLTDYNKLNEFVPHLKHSDVLGRKGNWVFLDQKFGHLVLTMDLILKVKEEPPQKVIFERYGGNMKTYEGEYQLEEANPGGTIFTLNVKAEPDFFVPQRVLEWVLKSELPKGLMAMRKRALLNAGLPEPKYSIEVVSCRDF